MNILAVIIIKNIFLYYQKQNQFIFLCLVNMISGLRYQQLILNSWLQLHFSWTCNFQQCMMVQYGRKRISLDLGNDVVRVDIQQT